MVEEKKIYLVSPRGFCAGVERAIEIVEKVLELYPPPIYVKHEIVHNQYVVESLKKRGVVFVEKVEEIPEGAVAIFSAHGSPPQDYQKARERNLLLIDATCPLVTKVHLEARRYAKRGYHILLIGHKNHVEVVGTYHEAPSQTTIVESIEDVEKLSFPPNTPLAYITQTTLSVEDTREIIDALKEKFPHIEGPKKEDICYATTNRQMAVKEIAKEVDLFLVIGSKNSSNSNRLREIAEKYTQAYLIDSYKEISPLWLEGISSVAITAGASAPEVLVQETVEFLKEQGFQKVEEVILKKETVEFPLPSILR